MIGTPGRGVVAPAATVTEPLKVGSVKWVGGAQLMARAGYDPREMANMFRTIEKQGGSNGPEWLSDHPNPGNRVEYIEKEAQSLRVENPIRSADQFERVRAVNHLGDRLDLMTSVQAPVLKHPVGLPSAILYSLHGQPLTFG